MVPRTVTTALAALALLACSDRPATAVVAAVATDEVTRQNVSHVRIQGSRGDAVSIDQTYPVDTFKTPGTLTFQDRQDGDSSALLHVVVEGFDKDPGDPSAARLIARSAKLRFVPEKSKLLRLALAKECLRISCSPGDTCYKGKCESELIEDPDNELPDAEPDQIGSPGASLQFPEFEESAGAGGAAGSGGQGGVAGEAQGGDAGEGGAAGDGDRKSVV